MLTQRNPHPSKHERNKWSFQVQPFKEEPRDGWIPAVTKF